MKKKILYFITLLLILLPINVFAASGTISVLGSSQGIVGNNLTITVKLSSNVKMGSWEFDINYDRSYLELSSSDAESGGTHAANTISGGTTSKSYTYKFKVKKSGSTNISVSSSDVYAYDDMSRMSMSNGSKKVTLKTQAEIEASYSNNANLKNLSVEGYEITPSFNANTTDYSLEVENDITSVNINASVADSNADVSGAGLKELVEGANKFNIVVTAQKGNTKTYNLTITRKELDPIIVNKDNKNLTIIRKEDSMPNVVGFSLGKVTYEGKEIPTLVDNDINMTLVALKDEDGNIDLYEYDTSSNKILDKFVLITNNVLSIIPSNLKENNDYKDYKINDLDIYGNKIKAYDLGDNLYVIYAKNLSDGKEGYYLYNSSDKSLISYIATIEKKYINQIKNYKYIILGLGIFIIIELFIIIFRKNNKKSNKKVSKDNKNEIKEIEIDKEDKSKGVRKSKKDDESKVLNKDDNKKLEDTINLDDYINDDFLDK